MIYVGKLPSKVRISNILSFTLSYDYCTTIIIYIFSLSQSALCDMNNIYCIM